MVSSDTLTPADCQVGDVLTNPATGAATLIAQDTTTGVVTPVAIGGGGGPPGPPGPVGPPGPPGPPGPSAGPIVEVPRAATWVVGTVLPNATGIPETQRSYPLVPMYPVHPDVAAIGASVTYDNGAGPAPLVFGVDWVLLPRALDQSTVGLTPQSWGYPTGPHPSVAGDRVGVLLLPTSPNLGALVPGLTVLRLEWTERVLTLPARGALAANTAPVGGVGPALEIVSPTWRLGLAGWITNALLLPQADGLQVELWRRTPRKGYTRDRRNQSFQIRRGGPVFTQFWRGVGSDPTHPLWLPLTEWTGTQSARRQEFRWCFYDPTTGARSTLSTERVIVQSRYNETVFDRNTGAARVFRAARSITVL